MSGVTQTTATRNQSTAVISDSKRVFIFDNRFKEGIFKNTSGAPFTMAHGMLVARSKTVANGFIPVTVDNLADVIGISAIEGSVELAAGNDVNMNIGTKGTVDGNFLILPATVTLNTVVGEKTLNDVLEGLGFHVDTSSVENTKIEN